MCHLIDNGKRWNSLISTPSHFLILHISQEWNKNTTLLKNPTPNREYSNFTLACSIVIIGLQPVIKSSTKDVGLEDRCSWFGLGLEGKSWSRYQTFIGHQVQRKSFYVFLVLDSKCKLYYIVINYGTYYKVSRMYAYIHKTQIVAKLMADYRLTNRTIHKVQMTIDMPSKPMVLYT